MKVVTILVTAVVFLGLPCIARETTEANPMDEEQILAGARLRNQDRMFALLMAAYFEVEQDKIDEQYDCRLKAWNSSTPSSPGLVLYAPSKLDKYFSSTIRKAAMQERELKMAHVAHNMTELIDLYEVTRLTDQKTIGASIPSAVDIESATQQIKRLLTMRRPHSRDIRLWTERETGIQRVTNPSTPKQRPFSEAAAEPPSPSEKAVKIPSPDPEYQGMFGAIFFGLPIFRTPYLSKP